MNWDDVHMFALVAHAGSFTSASQRSNLSAVSIARRVSTLEDSLTVKLLLRGTRGVTLTPAGAELLSKAEAAEAAMDDLTHTAKRLKTSGWARPIRITATEPVIADLVAPRIHTLLRSQPKLMVELNVSNTVVSLSAQDAEIALRFAKPEGNSLRVRKVAHFQLALFKSRDDRTPLSSARFIGYDDTYGEIPEVVWMRAQGFTDRMVLRSSSTAALVQAARSGLGIALLPRFIAERHADLCEITYTPAPTPRSLWMMAQPQIAKIPEIAQTMNWLANAFKEI